MIFILFVLVSRTSLAATIKQEKNCTVSAEGRELFSVRDEVQIIRPNKDKPQIIAKGTVVKKTKRGRTIVRVTSGPKDCSSLVGLLLHAEDKPVLQAIEESMSPLLKRMEVNLNAGYLTSSQTGYHINQTEKQSLSFPFINVESYLYPFVKPGKSVFGFLGVGLQGNLGTPSQESEVIGDQEGESGSLKTQLLTWNIDVTARIPMLEEKLQTELSFQPIRYFNTQNSLSLGKGNIQTPLRSNYHQSQSISIRQHYWISQQIRFRVGGYYSLKVKGKIQQELDRENVYVSEEIDYQTGTFWGSETGLDVFHNSGFKINFLLKYEHNEFDFLGSNPENVTADGKVKYSPRMNLLFFAGGLGYSF